METESGPSYTRLSWGKRSPSGRFMKDFESHKRDFGKSNDPWKAYEMELVMPGAPKSRYYDTDESVVKLYESAFWSCYSYHSSTDSGKGRISSNCLILSSQ